MPVTRSDSDIGDLSNVEPPSPPLTDKQRRILRDLDDRVGRKLIYENDGAVKEEVLIEYPLPVDFHDNLPDIEETGTIECPLPDHFVDHLPNPSKLIFNSINIILEEEARRNAHVYDGKVNFSYSTNGKKLYITISPKDPTPEV